MPSHHPDSKDNLWFRDINKNAISKFSASYFIKEIENIFFCLPIYYRNTCGSLGELGIM